MQLFKNKQIPKFVFEISQLFHNELYDDIVAAAQYASSEGFFKKITSPNYITWASKILKLSDDIFIGL